MDGLNFDVAVGAGIGVRCQSRLLEKVPSLVEELQP